MNFVAISPHFPPNYAPFWIQLHQMGVNVLGLADAPAGELRPELHSALGMYYRVENAQNYDEMLRALGYFTHRYGRIDRLESHNEFWLESDARLRTDFNIPGLKSSEMARIKRKSEMKKVFLKAGLQPARGRVVHTLAEARELAEEIGYPLVAKPDIGVGASSTYRLEDDSALVTFFDHKPPQDMIFEEFIHGDIVTYDGLTDQDGRVVFSSTMHYNSGILETVSQNLDFWYCIQRDLPEDLEQAGKRIVRVYGLRERFFHFEFFRTPHGQLVPLEVNMRPPGGLTTDLFNYANDMDIFREYANVVVHNRFTAQILRPYFCAYAGRKLLYTYRRSIEEIKAAFPRQVVHSEPISGVFSAAIGDYGFIVRSPNQAEIVEILGAILEKA